jgi:hypothetical protein
MIMAIRNKRFTCIFTPVHLRENDQYFQGYQCVLVSLAQTQYHKMHALSNNRRRALSKYQTGGRFSFMTKRHLYFASCHKTEKTDRWLPDFDPRFNFPPRP